MSNKNYDYILYPASVLYICIILRVYTTAELKKYTDQDKLIIVYRSHWKILKLD